MKEVVLDVANIKVGDEKVSCGFTGLVKIKVPKYSERLRLIKSLNINVDSSQEVKIDSSKMDMAIKISEIANEYVTEIDVTHESGDKFKSLDDLSYTQEGSSLINEFANFVLSGLKLGKN